MFEPQVGDLGIGCTFIKTGTSVPCTPTPAPWWATSATPPLSKTPLGEDTFHVRDLDDNLFQILPSDHWFSNSGTLLAASWGVVGVTDMEALFKLYKDILKYDKVLLDETGTFEDWAGLPGGDQTYRRDPRAVQPRHRRIRLLDGANAH